MSVYMFGHRNDYVDYDYYDCYNCDNDSLL